MPKRRQWTIASARQHLPAVVASAAREPQAVYRRKKLVAAVVSPELCAQMEEARAREARPRLAQALAELRRLCAEEAYQLPPPARTDRPVSSPGRRR